MPRTSPARVIDSVGSKLGSGIMCSPFVASTSAVRRRVAVYGCARLRHDRARRPLSRHIGRAGLARSQLSLRRAARQMLSPTIADKARSDVTDNAPLSVIRHRSRAATTERIRFRRNVASSSRNLLHGPCMGAQAGARQKRRLGFHSNSEKQPTPHQATGAGSVRVPLPTRFRRRRAPSRRRRLLRARLRSRRRCYPDPCAAARAQGVVQPGPSSRPRRPRARR